MKKLSVMGLVYVVVQFLRRSSFSLCLVAMDGTVTLGNYGLCTSEAGIADNRPAMLAREIERLFDILGIKLQLNVVSSPRTRIWQTVWRRHRTDPVSRGHYV